MKNLTLLLILIMLIVSCNQKSEKDTKNIKDTLAESTAKMESPEAKQSKANNAKAKAKAAWKSFKIESDSLILKMEDDLKALENKLKQASKEEKLLTINYQKATSDMAALKQRFKQKYEALEKDMDSLDEDVSQKSESFKREFKRDIDTIRQSLQDLLPL